ncbi:MAG: TetR/AcrR family transcriptional regulator [Atopobiaceae bacterium]|nr:TetR/AcrR family transcriptional regulator [Atopobiaceae bacterium]
MRPLVELHQHVPTASQEAHAVTCAAALFLRDGIASVKMTDIAEAAGVGVATLYRHYQTKTKLAVLAGTYMWQRFNELILEMVESDEFLAADGGERLSMLLESYVDAYVAYPSFVRFLDEFDHLVLSEGVSSSDLAEYGAAIDSFYLIFEDAYKMGRTDGSVTCEVDFDVFYRTVAHAMMGVAQKLVRGEIIPSDDFSHGKDELSCIVRMARFTLGTKDKE